MILITAYIVKEVGEEVVGCVLEVRGEEVRISLNPTLVESCRARGGGGGDGRKKKKSKDTAVSRISNQ